MFFYELFLKQNFSLYIPRRERLTPKYRLFLRVIRIFSEFIEPILMILAFYESSWIKGSFKMYIVYIHSGTIRFRI